jgi:hypothetical protein
LPIKKEWFLGIKDADLYEIMNAIEMYLMSNIIMPKRFKMLKFTKYSGT